MNSTPTASAVFLVESTKISFFFEAAQLVRGASQRQPTLPGTISATSAVFQKLRIDRLLVCLLGDTRRQVLSRGVTRSHPRLVGLSGTHGQADEI
jgi:hypothetical protein